MSEKSEARVKMEKALLEATYQMASESLAPYYFQQLEYIIQLLCKNRNLGKFNFFPRDENSNVQEKE